MRPTSTATLFPAFASGFVVLDARGAPSLRRAIGSRVFLRRTSAESFARRTRSGLARNDAEHVHVVPVDGPNDVFALDYVDAAGVVVGANGYIRIT